MSDLTGEFRTDPASTPWPPVVALRTCVREGTRLERGDTMERISIPVSRVRPFELLRQVPEACTKLGWSWRDGSAALVGIGEALRIDSETGNVTKALQEEMARILAGAPGETRFIGGLRFSQRGADEPAWRGYETAWFVVPRIELICRGHECRLNLYRRTADAGGFEEGLALLESFTSVSVRSHATLPTLVERCDIPDRSAWHQNVLRALDAFGANGLRKVVLARLAHFRMADRVDPLMLAMHLRQVTNGCYQFYFHPAGGDVFLGATPERLYRRDVDQVHTEAVAGTRPRGGSEAEDFELGEGLLASDKDRREHAYVCEGIRHALSGLCDGFMSSDDPALLKLSMGQHLHTPAKARLRAGVTDGDLLAALHPTPALGGWPRPAALDAIARWEAFDRGWYGAPVGWVTRDATEFAVAIRSALVHGNELSLFSGAGIVDGSTPDAEWEEVEQKLSDFLQVLGG